MTNSFPISTGNATWIVFKTFLLKRKQTKNKLCPGNYRELKLVFIQVWLQKKMSSIIAIV